MDMMKRTGKNFLEDFVVKQRALSWAQCEYRRLLAKKLYTRKQRLYLQGVQRTIEGLRDERNDLRARIWVAEGASNERTNKRYMEQIQCHVECQEGLAGDIHDLRLSFKQLEQEVARTKREVYRLNTLTVPESRFQAYAAQWRNKLQRLEDQNEICIRRECTVVADNAKLRQKLEGELNRRQAFNFEYSKLIQQLNHDRKYMIELIEYAIDIYDSNMHAYERMEHLKGKTGIEAEEHKRYMENFMRTMAAEEVTQNFLECKGKPRELADLLPKEYARREMFRQKHIHKINLYTSVVEKIMKYAQSDNVQAVIDKFREQESLYYSYFSYANEMGYHMELLDRSVHRLLTTIKYLKYEEADTLQEQLSTIATLLDNLERKRKRNAKLQQRSDENDEFIHNMLEEFQQMFKLTKSNYSPLRAMLGDNKTINLVNARRVLRILEMRLQDIVAGVYVSERENERMKREDYCVRDTGRPAEPPTPLEDIVLAQQCAECAEGEAFNVEEADEGVIIYSMEETRRKLYEKIKQPEMQYRLHSISHCRLPRSRKLVAKRNM